jgi:pimeloyl-ACP methyl ester carboxylesterase
LFDDWNFHAYDYINKLLKRNVPMLWVSGDGDLLASQDILTEIIETLLVFDTKKDFLDGDWKSRGEDMISKKVKGFEWVRFQKGGHVIFFDNEKDLDTLIREFLSNN